MSEEQLPRDAVGSDVPASDELAQSEMSFWDHLDELRRVLMRIILVTVVIALGVFMFKDEVFAAVLAPSKGDFLTYRGINHLLVLLGWDSMLIPDTDITLINTQLAAQFMTHITVSMTIGLLAAAPYVVYELFGFVKPALYENERRYSNRIMVAVIALFFLGVAMNYFVIFPVSVKFLGTYQVHEGVVNTIALSSYISTFTTLSLMMGLVFEIPVLVYFLASAGMISGSTLAKYRRHAFVIIMVVSAFITPPDAFTLALMTVPLYALYEVSIVIARRFEKREKKLAQQD